MHTHATSVETPKQAALYLRGWGNNQIHSEQVIWRPTPNPQKNNNRKSVKTRKQLTLPQAENINTKHTGYKLQSNMNPKAHR